MPLPPLNFGNTPQKPQSPGPGASGPTPTAPKPVEPIDLTADPPPHNPSAGSTVMTSDKIRTFGDQKSHVDQWARTPNVTGTGAIHCKVFHAKLREDAIDNMERQMNEWLDKHPEYEVKYVTSSIGDLKTKTITEQAIFVTVWV